MASDSRAFFGQSWRSFQGERMRPMKKTPASGCAGRSTVTSPSRTPKVLAILITIAWRLLLRAKRNAFDGAGTAAHAGLQAIGARLDRAGGAFTGDRDDSLTLLTQHVARAADDTDIHAGIALVTFFTLYARRTSRPWVAFFAFHADRSGIALISLVPLGTVEAPGQGER